MDLTAAQEPETNHEMAGESDGSALGTELLRKRKVSRGLAMMPMLQQQMLNLEF